MDLNLTRGVTAPLAGPAPQKGAACTTWNVLQLTDDSGTRILTDLGELVPARLTSGRPGKTGEAAGAQALRTWAPLACSLATVRSAGVRTVNAWSFADQPLPDGSGTATWVCTRAATWRGDGTTVLAQFQAPDARYGAVAAKRTDVTACSPREPHVLAGVLWKSGAGDWYLLAAGGRDTASIHATGGVTASAEDNLLAADAERDSKVKLKGTLEDGTSIGSLG
jgi:hypothetical protein